MTAASTVAPETVAPHAAVSAEPTCDVCHHSLSRHDRVALRYCDATQHNALSRGCLCR